MTLSKEYSIYTLIDTPMHFTKEECQRLVEKAKDTTQIIFIGEHIEQEIVSKENGCPSLMERLKKETNSFFIDEIPRK